MPAAPIPACGRHYLFDQSEISQFQLERKHDPHACPRVDHGALLTISMLTTMANASRCALRSSLVLCILLATASAFVPAPGSRPQQSFAPHYQQVGPRHLWPNYIKDSAPEGPSKSNKKSDADEQQYEVERFRNRADLTQSILKEKVQEVKLLKSKILILQDVVNRLQTESKNEIERKLKLQESKNTQTLETLQGEFKKTKTLLEEQAQQQAKVVQDLEADLVEQQRDSSAQVEIERSETLKLETQIKALQKEVLDMDQTLETTQGELQQVQKRLVSREDEIRSLAEKGDRKRNSLEKKVNQLETERQSALTKSTMAEELRQESIEIANAAVQAAAKREEALTKELEELKKTVSTLQQEQEQLQSQLETGDGNSILQGKIATLEKKLLEEKLAKNVKQNVEEEQFEARLQVERQKHEEELHRLRARLQRKDEPNPTVLQRRDEVTPTVARGRLQRLWSRLRS